MSPTIVGGVNSVQTLNADYKRIYFVPDFICTIQKGMLRGMLKGMSPTIVGDVNKSTPFGNGGNAEIKL